MKNHAATDHQSSKKTLLGSEIKDREIERLKQKVKALKLQSRSQNTAATIQSNFENKSSLFFSWIWHLQNFKYS